MHVTYPSRRRYLQPCRIFVSYAPAALRTIGNARDAGGQALIIVITGLITRELGGGLAAQLVAGVDYEQELPIYGLSGPTGSGFARQWPSLKSYS
jgi:hypothetical protein